MPSFKQCLAIVSLLVAMPLTARAADTDPRDYEALTALPNRSAAAVIYYRHISANDTQSYSQDVALLRAAYELRWGHLSLVPIDIALPIADVSAYATPVPLGGYVGTLRASGIGDFLFFPTVGYLIPEGQVNHTYVAFTPFFEFPTGQYDHSHAINIGTNRYTFIQQLAVGQRFLKIVDVEGIVDFTEYTDNTDVLLTPPLIPAGMLTVTQKQAVTYGFTLHASVDVAPFLWLAVGYLLNVNGRVTLSGFPGGLPDVVRDPQQYVNTLRFTAGIRVEKGTLVLLQYSQDVATSGSTMTIEPPPISRYFGVRISHVW
jgi:hypothetical protein